jgi:hypothetical protein
MAEGSSLANGPEGGLGTRERILEYAVDVLDELGESALVVLDLSKKTGISMGSIYHFFGDREGLIVSAQAERYRRSLGTPFNDFAAELDAAPDRATFREVVTRLFAAMDTPEGRQRRLMRASVYGTLATRPALLEQVRAAHRVVEVGLATMIRRAQEKGIVRAELDADAFAAWWHGVLAGRVVQDTGLTDIPVERWSRMSQQAIFALAFGELPGDA